MYGKVEEGRERYGKVERGMGREEDGGAFKMRNGCYN